MIDNSNGNATDHLSLLGRPEVVGRLKLAERHRHLADRYNVGRRPDQGWWGERLRRHRAKAQKHEARAARMAAAWLAQHPERSEV